MESNTHIVHAFLQTKKPGTRKQYRNGLNSWRSFAGFETVEQATDAFLAGGLRAARKSAIAFRDRKIEGQPLPAANINRSISALRELAKYAKTCGQIAWILDVKTVPRKDYKNPLGVGVDGIALILSQVKGSKLRVARNRAIIRLAYDLGLRRSQLEALRLQDISYDLSSIQVKRWGRAADDGSLTRTLPAATQSALVAWLNARSAMRQAVTTASVFLGLKDGRPLIGTAIWKIVAGHARRAGLSASPKTLRNTAISAGLDASGGDLASVGAFAGLRTPLPAIIYDNVRRAWRSHGDVISECVSASL